MATLHRIFHLIVRPLDEWDRIAGERTSVDALLRRIILPFSLLAPIATVIGMNLFDQTWDPMRGSTEERSLPPVLPKRLKRVLHPSRDSISAAPPA